RKRTQASNYNVAITSTSIQSFSWFRGFVVSWFRNFRALTCDLPLRVSRRLRARVLYVLIEPVHPLGEHVQQCFPRSVAVRFVRQHHEADGRAESFERGEEALRVDRVRPRVVVRFAVHQQDWILDLIRVPE